MNRKENTSIQGIHIRKAEHEDLPKIAAFIAHLNKLPEHQCLHCDEDEQGVSNAIAELGDAPEKRFSIAVQDSHIVGVLGYDSADDDAWMWGPFVIAEDWEQVTENLYNLLMRDLPEEIHTLHTFSSITNQRSHQFYLNHGFVETKTSHIYTAAPPTDRSMLQTAEVCGELEERYVSAFAELHNVAFPGTPISAQEILDSLDDDHKIFVSTDSERLLGYLYATINNAPVEGYVEFLAVQPGARGQGVGRRLLISALRWFFEDKQMPQAGLVVLDERTNAQALYQRAGFSLAYTGVSAKKEVC